MVESRNYSGRTLDLELLKTVTSTDSAVEVRLGVVDSPKRVTALQKLIQRYTLLLLSGIGTVRFAEYQGGALARRVAEGTVSSVALLQHLLHMASDDAITLMKADDSDSGFGNQPADERIDSVEFSDLRIDYSASTAYATATITTAAGTAAEFVIPIS